MTLAVEGISADLEIALIRTDGGTQARNGLKEATVQLYSNLMRDGLEFPPVRVWFDGAEYWLSDGFHRLAATKSLGRTHMDAVVHAGNLNDAKWDSFGSNSTHGLRRTRAETKTVALKAVKHAKAKGLSNNQVAQHLGVPEATLRRWRKSSGQLNVEEETRRLAVRQGKAYLIRTAGIGGGPKRCSYPRRAKSLTELRTEIEYMKAQASTTARRILNVVNVWAFGTGSAEDCLESIENVVTRQVNGADQGRSESGSEKTTVT